MMGASMSQTVGRYRLGQRLTSDALTGTHEGFAPDERGYEQKFVVRVAKLPEDLGTELFDRFRGEAKAAAALKHDNVVPLLDHGVADHAAYVVHPAIESLSLRALLDKAEKKKLPHELVALIGLDIARGIEHAHRKTPPVIHGGISPDAVAVDIDGMTRVSDFALVNLLTAASNSHSQLLEHTCRYHSPEQAKHRPLTIATDIFSLGATLYEALAGKPAFFAPTPLAIVLKISMASHDKLDSVAPEVPAPLRQLVTKMLTADPSSRPTDDAVITALEGIVGRPEKARTDLGLRVKPASERTSKPVAPAVPAKSIPLEEEEEEEEEEEKAWEDPAPSFPAFDEIAGEKTTIDTTHLSSEGPALPPPRVSLPTAPNRIGAPAPQPALRNAPPLAVSVPSHVVDMPVEKTDELPPEEGGHTEEIDDAPAPWPIERTVQLSISSETPLNERDTNPPPPPSMPARAFNPRSNAELSPSATLVMVQNPLAPPPPPQAQERDPFAADEPKQPRKPLDYSLPIVIALGVGAIGLMIFAALFTVWLAS